MSKRRTFRTYASLGLVLGGAVLLVYGILFHVTVVSSAKDVGANALTRPEPVLIRDVTFGEARPPVEVAKPSVEPSTPDVNSVKPSAELAKQGDAPEETKKPETSTNSEAPKACPT